MKGDFTRSTFRPQRHYKNVRMQQGRVQTDADWNEQADLAGYRMETGSQDTIGLCGAPLERPGFGLLGGADPRLTAGHFYVDGILCENDREIELDRQPDLPGFTLPTADGFYLAYLDAFDQHVTALEDPLIREVALGGPDTTTRARAAWQVKLLGPFGGPLHCSTALAEWTNLVERPRGGLRARTNPGSVSSDPCIISPGGGYRRLENQLYRVEMHTPGARGVARFKWSRDNGSIATLWEDQQGGELVVRSIGRDAVLGFAPGQTVEVSDDARELRGTPGILVRLSGAEGNVLLMDSTDPAAGTVDKSDFPDDNSLGAPNHPKVRRWDSDGTLATGAGWIALEDGVEVSFEPGNYQVGDYWLIPARTATDDVEWPLDSAGDPIAQEPDGVRHHFCRLAVLQRAAGSFTLVEDCRPLFPALNSLMEFSYRGGDGQEALPGAALSQPLRVGVSVGGNPVGVGALAGLHYQVQFSTAAGGHLGAAPGGLDAQPNTFTVRVTNGGAQCFWLLDRGNGSRAALRSLYSQTVTARLLDSAGADVGLLPVVFNAQHSLSSQVEFHPTDECNRLDGVATVEEAIDKLCAFQEVGGRCCIPVGIGGEYPTLETAIRDLAEKNVLHICLCLLPGEHKAPPFDLTFPGKVLGHLRVNGGANAVLRLEGPWKLSRFASVTLENLIVAAGMIGDAAPFIALTQMGQVTLRNCQFSAEATQGVLLGIEAITDVLIENSHVEVARRTQTPGRAVAGTVLEEVFFAEDRKTSAVVASGVTRETLGKMKVKDRREITATLRKFVNDNAATLSAGESSVLLAVAADLNATRVDEDLLTVHVLELVDASSVPGRALFINAPRAQVMLRGNQIFGEVSLYGAPASVEWDDDGIAALLRVFKNGISAGSMRLLGTGSTLQLTGNRFTRVAWSQALFDRIRAVVQAGNGSVSGLASHMTSSDNIFTVNRNYLVGNHVDMHHNVFTTPTESFLAACFGESGVYVGNKGPSKESLIVTSHPDGEKAVAANLRVNIQ